MNGNLIKPWCKMKF